MHEKPEEPFSLLSHENPPPPPLPMAFRHRKLATYSPPMDPIKYCEENCDPIRNPDLICTDKCFWCPSVCENPPPAVVFTTTPTQNPPRISLLLTISISALATAFSLFTCYAIYKFYSNWCSRRRRSLRREDGASEPDFFPDQDPAVDHHVWYIRTVGLQPSVIGAITIVKYKKGDGLIDGSDCSVCLSEFQEDESLRLLPKCNHAFHVSCIDTWLGAHTNCPICRAGIVNSSDDQIVQDPGPVEELRQGNGDSENDPIEAVVGIEDATGSQLKVDLADGIQPLRRSISVDSLSVAAKSDRQLVGVKDCESGVVVGRRAGFNQGLLRLIGGSSIQTGSTHSMKRSHSCSANVLLSKHGSRNRN